MLVQYNSRKSGGSWWLSDKDWKALEGAGWEVEWGGQDVCHVAFRTSRKGPSKAPNTCPARDENGLLTGPSCQGHRRFASYEECVASGERFLGTLAQYATKECESVAEAMVDFAEVTSLDPDAEGCTCCGHPHYFSEATP